MKGDKEASECLQTRGEVQPRRQVVLSQCFQSPTVELGATHVSAHTHTHITELAPRGAGLHLLQFQSESPPGPPLTSSCSRYWNILQPISGLKNKERVNFVGENCRTEHVSPRRRRRDTKTFFGTIASSRKAIMEGEKSAK